MQTRFQGLQEGIKERDRNMARMKEQVKYYIAFAEHSAKSHAGIGSDNEVKELDALIKELQDAKVLNFKQDYLYVFKWLNVIVLSKCPFSLQSCNLQNYCFRRKCAVYLHIIRS